MKFLRPLFLLPLALLLTACLSSNEHALSKVRSNKMNFPDPVQRTHDGVSFKLSELFTDSYYTEFVIQQNATTKSINEMNLHFSVETFKRNDISSIRFIDESKDSDLELIHEHYVQIRRTSLEEFTSSIRKKVPKSVGFPGYITVIEGGSAFDSKTSTYMTASIEIDKKIYVFQLIGPSNHMGYFYDDFMLILSSIEK